MSTRWTIHDLEKLQKKGLAVQLPEKAPVNKYRFIIGIDAGCNTGFAVYDNKCKKLEIVDCIKIHQALDKVKIMSETWTEGVFVRVEDARLSVHGRNNITDKNKLQGAGSIKRDAKIWEEFLKDLGVPYEMVRPNNKVTKFNSEIFKKITGWTGQTNEHARDAAMICWGVTKR